MHEFHSKIKGQNPSESDLKQFAKTCLLPLSVVKIWLDHLKQGDHNRKIRAEKAREEERNGTNKVEVMFLVLTTQIIG